jgi:Raf kinase inhibitor-like YbhB/YbcL family protein
MRSRVVALSAAASIAVLGAAPVSAQAPAPTEVGASQLAIVNLPARSSTALTVQSPAFRTGEDIPFENTQYRGNVFPGLTWTPGPKGTKSYVIIMQDADALRNGAPILHWTMYNIPPTVTMLNAGLSTAPEGASFGPNIRGADQAYLGPRTPPGPKHRYHIQVFALDNLIKSTAKSYTDLTGAMSGHVLASGQIVGLGSVPPSGTH